MKRRVSRRQFVASSSLGLGALAANAVAAGARSPDARTGGGRYLTLGLAQIALPSLSEWNLRADLERYLLGLRSWIRRTQAGTQRHDWLAFPAPWPSVGPEFTAAQARRVAIEVAQLAPRMLGKSAREQRCYVSIASLAPHPPTVIDARGSACAPGCVELDEFAIYPLGSDLLAPIDKGRNCKRCIATVAAAGPCAPPGCVPAAGLSRFWTLDGELLAQAIDNQEQIVTARLVSTPAAS
jgi:hypothetical protein